MSLKDILQNTGLMEADPHPAPMPHPHQSHPVAPDATAPQPFIPQSTFTPAPGGFAPLNATVFAPPTPVYAGAVMDDAAQAQMKAIEAEVYRQQNTPYMLFQKVRHSMHDTAAFSEVFSVMEASGSGVTQQKVLASIDDHLAIIQKCRQSFENDLAQAKTQKVDQPTQQIADLTKANEAAMAQINANNQKITELQQTIQQGQTAIGNGVARFKAIEDVLSAPLLQSKQLLSSQGTQ